MRKTTSQLAILHAFSAPSIHFPHMAVHGVLAKFVYSLESFLSGRGNLRKFVTSVHHLVIYVKGRLPVDYPMRFSSPVTTSQPAVSGMATSARHFARYKDALVLAVFSNSSLSPFFPLALHLPAPPHPVVPQAAPSSPYSLRPPLSDRTDTTRPVGKMP